MKTTKFKFITPEQMEWILRKNIKVGSFYSFPAMGFSLYASPSYSDYIDIETNPFTKSLSGQFFLVKEKVNGFCKGNFYEKPHHTDFYLHESELESRNLFEIMFLLLILSIPLGIINFVRCATPIKKQAKHKNKVCKFN